MANLSNSEKQEIGWVMSILSLKKTERVLISLKQRWKKKNTSSAWIQWEILTSKEQESSNEKCTTTPMVLQVFLLILKLNHSIQDTIKRRIDLTSETNILISKTICFWWVKTHLIKTKLMSEWQSMRKKTLSMVQLESKKTDDALTNTLRTSNENRLYFERVMSKAFHCKPTLQVTWSFLKLFQILAATLLNQSSIPISDLQLRLIEMKLTQGTN